MATSRARIIILTFLVLPATFTEGAQPPEPKADLYCDPLPPGAIARCGTIRLRQPDLSRGIAASFAPDGKSVATKDAKTLRLWDAATGKLLWELAENEPPTKLLFSPDGKQIAVTGKDASICLVDSATGKLLRRIATKTTVLALSPDGKLLATAGAKGEVFLWHTARGEQLFNLDGHEKALCGGAFTPNGGTLITVSIDGRCCRWNVATGKRIQRIDFSLPKRANISLSADGQTLAVDPPNDGPISLWDVKTGKQRCELQRDLGADWRIQGFAPDGRTLATSTSNGKRSELVISLWNAETGKLRRRFSLPSSAAYYVQIAPDGCTLLTYTHNGAVVHLLDVATVKRRFDWPAHEQIVWTLAFTRDGQRLVSGAWDGTLRMWDAATGKHERQLTSHKWGVLSMVLSTDGKSVVSGGYDGMVRSQELATGTERWRFDIDQPPEKQETFQNLVYQLGMAPDGRSAVSFTYAGKNDGLIHILDLATGKPILRRSFPFTEFRNGSFSPDGRFILGTREWIPGPRTPANDSKTFEAQRDNAVVFLQEVATGREVFSVRLPDFNAHYHRITPDGRMIVTLTRQIPESMEYRLMKTTLRVWELASGKERLAIDLPVEGDGFHIVRLALSDDCRTLAASRTDRILQLWDLASGNELVRRKGYASQAAALAFTPDGKRLASGHQDGTILIWDLSPEIDRRPNPPKADAKTVEQWWTALAGDDAKAAHAAIWGLVAAPELTLPLLRDYLRPAEAPPAEKLKQLVSDLDSEEFAKRTAANKELSDLEELAEPTMREALKEEISAEKRKRLEKLLDITLNVRTPERLRQLRAVEVLEHIGTPEARKLLQTVTTGAPEARLTRDAKAALQRLERR